MRIISRTWPLLVCALVAAAPCAWGQTSTSVVVSIRTGQNQIVSGAQVSLAAPSGQTRTTTADEAGDASFTSVQTGEHTLTIKARGFGDLSTLITVRPGAENHIDAELAANRTDSITVEEKPENPVEQEISTPVSLNRNEVKLLPEHPATVAEALPLAPDVIRLPSGELRLGGSAEHRSALLVNSANVTDPATGRFGATVPIDSVETMNVLSSPFLAEYGGFTANVVSVETRKAGNKWNFELNDPLPEFRFRSWHMRGLRSATPRINFSGPIIANKLFLVESAQYEVRATPVITLPFPHNEERREGYNSFTSLDYTAGASNVLSATLHVAQWHTRFANMDFFNPEPVSPNTTDSTLSWGVSDKAAIRGGLLDSGLFATTFRARTWPQGDLGMTFTPSGNSGNYFHTQRRNASRLQWREAYSFTRNFFGGPHNLKFGSNVAGTALHGRIESRPVSIRDNAGKLLETIEFTGGLPIERTDLGLAFYAQDHWVVTPRFAIEYGARAETQRVSSTFHIEPRLGLAWTPLGSGRTVIRAGYGFFFDRDPLNIYGFTNWPQQIITRYGPAGNIVSGPDLFYNLTDATARSESPFIYAKRKPGNFSPNSVNWNVQLEQMFNSRFRVRATYRQSASDGLVILNPQKVQDQHAFVLSGTGTSRLKQLEITSALRAARESQVYLSFVHGKSTGNLNDFDNFLAGFPPAIIQPDHYTNTSGDVPNRFLGWGTVRFPGKIALMPKAEFRSGLPYTKVDEWQNYVGVPNQQRFPRFFSVDARVSKDFKINDKYSVRFAVSGINLTNHFNPVSVHANIADPWSGTFFSGYHRRYTMDFDFLF